MIINEKTDSKLGLKNFNVLNVELNPLYLNSGMNTEYYTITVENKLTKKKTKVYTLIMNIEGENKSIDIRHSHDFSEGEKCYLCESNSDECSIIEENEREFIKIIHSHPDMRFRLLHKKQNS